MPRRCSRLIIIYIGMLEKCEFMNGIIVLVKSRAFHNIEGEIPHGAVVREAYVRDIIVTVGGCRKTKVPFLCQGLNRQREVGWGALTEELSEVLEQRG